MEERPLTVDDQIADLYERTEELLRAIEKMTDLLGLHTESLKAINKAISSLIPVKDRRLIGDIQ